MDWIWIVLVITILILSYYYLMRPYNYWIDRNVPQGKPVPLFGDLFQGIFQLVPLSEMITNFYNAAGTETRYIGLYQFAKPMLMLRDPDLIKQVCVKNFDHFVNHSNFLPDEGDPIWYKNLFVLKDEKWRNMRTTLSPVFTSSKMKNMFTYISECAENFTNHFVEQNKPVITVELGDIFTKYTNDVIASTAFGFKCDSLQNPKNEFYLMGKELQFVGIWKGIKFFAINLMPSVFKMLGITFFSPKVSKFFRKIIKEAIELRESGKVNRQDMVQLLLDSRKNAIKHEEELSEMKEEISKGKHLILSDDDITAQALVFFFAGFDSSSNFMCMLGYELAANPEIQKKLQDEIDNTLNSCNGKITYEALTKMKYFDMVISESLRKWPNMVAFDRVVNKPFTIEPVRPGEKPVHLVVDDIVTIPSYAMQNDPKLFPNPEKFDPERFNDENKANIHPYAYTPFGAGPRSCIGNRFALLETKTLFVHVLTKFNLVPVEKSKIPIVLEKSVFRITAKDGFWFGLQRREVMN